MANLYQNLPLISVTFSTALWQQKEKNNQVSKRNPLLILSLEYLPNSMTLLSIYIRHPTGNINENQLYSYILVYLSFIYYHLYSFPIIHWEANIIYLTLHFFTIMFNNLAIYMNISTSCFMIILADKTKKYIF
jgi:hypothetical protein